MKRLLILAFLMSPLYAHDGGVITNIVSNPRKANSGFHGIHEKADLDKLLEVAWGYGRWGLHRGHAPIRGVLEAFLGITHRKMHFYMEEKKLNLAGLCEELNLEPDNLVASLAASFTPFVEEAVKKGIIDSPELWQEKIDEAFKRRVYWEG